MNTSPQKWFILTIPEAEAKFTDVTFRLDQGVQYVKGQLEVAPTTGYRHWQLIAVMKKNSRLTALKRIFGQSAHVEATRSAAAAQYVWKEETRVPGTQFEHGTKPLNPGSKTDWDLIWDAAKSGKMELIPASVKVRSYSQLKNIAKDHMCPEAMERKVIVYWGPTGTGKSRKAWQEAGFSAYPKDPMTKFWDGYHDHANVVIDEYRGDIAISHLLRWFDRYPVCIEAKHGGTVLKAKNIWITSNLHPDDWYPLLDRETKEALKRRLEIIHVQFPINFEE